MSTTGLKPAKRPEDDQAAVLCVTLVAICIMIALQVQLQYYVAVVIPLAELTCQVFRQLKDRK